ncbi:hypothetical protein ACLOJK_035759, partial [Asimina triloba]
MSNIMGETLASNATASLGFLFSSDAEKDRVISISVFVAVLCLCILIGHLLEDNRWVNESITAILIVMRMSSHRGCITGAIILILSKGTKSHILRFDEELFFIYLLPPIIFNAGYMAVLGCQLSTPNEGALGAIFSSTDTVCTLQVLHQDETPLLYSLVFGEGVVNDATSVVLFNAIQKLDVSKLDGWAIVQVGILTAYALKTLYFSRHAFATMSFIAETFIFLYVGMDALDLEKWKMTKSSVEMSFIINSTLILLMVLGRAAFVFPLSALSNYISSSAERNPITFKHQVNVPRLLFQGSHSIIIWWAGLMRGAVSIALAFHQVFGFFTKPLINVLLPHNMHGSHQRPDSPKEDLTLPLLSRDASATTNMFRAKNGLSLLLVRPVHTIHSYWRKFDDTYMRPIFGGAVGHSKYMEQRPASPDVLGEFEFVQLSNQLGHRLIRCWDVGIKAQQGDIGRQSWNLWRPEYAFLSPYNFLPPKSSQYSIPLYHVFVFNEINGIDFHSHQSTKPPTTMQLACSSSIRPCPKIAQVGTMWKAAHATFAWPSPALKQPPMQRPLVAAGQLNPRKWVLAQCTQNWEMGEGKDDHVAKEKADKDDDDKVVEDGQKMMENEHKAMDTVLVLHTAIKNRNLRELSDVIAEECRFVCNSISSLTAFQGKKQVLEFFSSLMKIMGENIEFVIQPSPHGGMNVSVKWSLDVLERWYKSYGHLEKSKVMGHNQVSG